ncbi:MAG TPA: hypothetical protein VF824_13280 [Thermoanaerobaculia bacterium]|jgi:ankyrin repeat protein
MSDDHWYLRRRLHFAAFNGYFAEAEELIAEGYDANALDGNPNAHHIEKIGDTPLGQVAHHCSMQVASLLLEAGADPTIRGWMQQNAIDRARQRTDPGGREVLRLLEAAAGRRNAQTTPPSESA